MVARTICLIVIPVMIYVGVFYAHLSILNRSGPGESYMERETQNELKGYYPVDTPLRKCGRNIKKSSGNGC